MVSADVILMASRQRINSKQNSVQSDMCPKLQHKMVVSRLRNRHQQVGNVTDLPCSVPQWGAADAEVKVPSGENTDLTRSPFKAWSRSVYSHTCYAYCQGFLPCLFLPFRSIHLRFSKTSPDFLLCWLCLTHGSCVGLQNNIGHPAGCRFLCWVPAEYK